MSGADRKRPSRALAQRPGYEVGYGKPPKKTRFKPGQSGNPGGRPRGAKTKRPAMYEERLKNVILEEAYRGVPIRDGARAVTIPMAQAVMRSLAVNAAKGDLRSQRLFAELLGHTESANKLLHDEWLETAITYKVEWEKELHRREVLGITDLPEPLPHPDHIVIDLYNGTASIRGPATKEEKADYDELLRLKERLPKFIELLQEYLEEIEDAEKRAEIQERLDRAEAKLERIRLAIPD